MRFGEWAAVSVGRVWAVVELVGDGISGGKTAWYQ